MQVTAEDSGTLHALYSPLYRKSAGFVGCTYWLYFDCGRTSVSWSWSGTQWWTTSCRICPQSVAPTMTKVWVHSWGCSTVTCPRPDGRRKGAWNGYWLSGCLVTLFAGLLFTGFLQSFKVSGKLCVLFQGLESLWKIINSAEVFWRFVNFDFSDKLTCQWFLGC